MTATDWTAYYRKPAPTASVTRRITQRRLLDIFSRHLPSRGPTICEIGGGNSCFVDAVLAQQPVSSYHVIDNNELGLQKLRKRFPGNSVVTASNGDVLQPKIGRRYDLVYSVGLIEHFDENDTRRAIKTHFQLAKPGGIVVITFPTPTWLYRATRKAAELTGQWRFPDERPLPMGEVADGIRRHGTILESFINWPIVLTQGIVVARLPS